MITSRRSLLLRWALEGALVCVFSMAVLFTLTAVVFAAAAPSPTTRGVVALGVATLATGVGAGFAAHRAWRRGDVSRPGGWTPGRDVLLAGLAGPVLLVIVGGVAAIAAGGVGVRSGLALLAQQALLLLGGLTGAAAVARAASREQPYP